VLETNYRKATRSKDDENDASTRPPNLFSASRDLGIWSAGPKSW